MLYPVTPSDKKMIIQIDRGRCIVARYRQTGPYAYTIERAANWEALEDEACAAVESQIGAITGDDVYSCPEEIVERARWTGTPT